MFGIGELLVLGAIGYGIKKLVSSTPSQPNNQNSDNHDTELGENYAKALRALDDNEKNNGNEVPKNEQKKEYYISNSFHTKVVGVTFEGRQRYVKECYVGQSLDLVRDKMNPYDSNAIAVYAGNNQVGFISKELASKLAPQMDQGKVFSCEVSEVTGGGQNNYGLNIKIGQIETKKVEEYNSERWDDDQWSTEDIADYYGYQYDDEYSASQFLDDL